MDNEVRVGIGYDVHCFAEGRRCVLGGVEIPYPLGLLGHSDADVLAHAVADALLGAVGEPDIGFYFPPEDASIEGVSSMEILKKVAEVVAGKGGHVVNIDATVIAEEPKILKHVPAMREAMGAALGLEAGRIGIKATSNERMGFIGRGEGVAAMAVASVAVGRG